MCSRRSKTQAVTIPLAALTAVVGLYAQLHLPPPWQTATTPIPLIVYGAAGAVGSFVIKLAKLSNIHPIIAIAGNGKAHVETLIDRSQGDNIVDYRDGNEALISGIKDALNKAGHKDILYAWDAVSEHGSFQNISEVLKEGGHITLIRPEEDYSAIPRTISRSITYVGVVNQNKDSGKWMAPPLPFGHELGLVWSRLFTKGLQEGWFSGHPFEVRPGGLGGVEGALKDLKAGKASAVKYVFRIAETEELDEV
jgi:NADPH2:quinone reductase